MIQRKHKNLEYNHQPIFTIDTLCVFCQERPTLPHHIGCGHIYCYFCLMGNIEADSSFSCIECGSTGKVSRISDEF